MFGVGFLLPPVANLNYLRKHVHYFTRLSSYFRVCVKYNVTGQISKYVWKHQKGALRPRGPESDTEKEDTKHLVRETKTNANMEEVMV